MRLFARNLVRGSTHLCQGQEAVTVGACSALREGDTMTCTYRGHGAVLAMGAPLDRRDGRDPGQGRRPVRGQGRLDAPDRRLGRRARLVRGRRRPPAVRLRHRARGADARDRLGLAVLLRGRRDEHRRVSRGDEPGLDVEARRSCSCARTTSTASTRRSRRRRRSSELVDRAAAYAMPGRAGRRQRRRWRCARPSADACEQARAGRRPDADRGAHLPAHGPLAQRPRRPTGRRASSSAGGSAIRSPCFEQRLEATAGSARADIDAARSGRPAGGGGGRRPARWPGPSRSRDDRFDTCGRRRDERAVTYREAVDPGARRRARAPTSGWC